jgi:hypothetical protein
MSALRFAFYIEGPTLPKWQRQCVELLRSSGVAVLCAVIRGVRENPDGLPRTQGAPQKPLGGVALCQEVGADAIGGAETGELPCRLSYDRAGAYRPDPESLYRIAMQRLDFILDFAGAPEGLETCATYGTWRFARCAGLFGAYPFVYALCRQDDTVTFSLEALLPGLSCAQTLYDGHLRARGKRSREVCRDVLAQAVKWPMLVATYLSLNGSLPLRSGEPGSSPPHRESYGKLMARLWLRDLFETITAKSDSLFFLETWNVGVSRMDVRDFLRGHKLRDVQWLPRHKSANYIADPFVFECGRLEVKCLVEDYSYFGRGRISQVTFRPGDRGAGLEIKRLLDRPYHLSYPYVFSHDRDLYCLPESHESNGSTLYRFGNGRLIPVREIVKNQRITDPSLLFHGGYYWLFCGMQDDEDQANLYIFYARNLEGPWQPHPLNPVKTDVRSSRSAGQIIEHGDDLYRPTQNCSVSYGYGICINRIDTLTTTRFAETPVIAIAPGELAKGCLGVHTLSFKDDVVVVDGKFRSFGAAPLAFTAYKLARRLKRKIEVGAFKAGVLRKAADRFSSVADPEA